MNENKDIITLETAVLAKEKGFQEEELHYYFNGELLQHPNRLYYNYNQDNPPIGQFSAPYQSFLQKWLREWHKLHITIYSKSQESWMFRVTKPGQLLEEGIYGEDYEDYEDALEDALQEALNLINE